jgi:ABC-2 type transport system permease protein
VFKVWAVAVREYKAAVQTKAFIISIVMMPVLWGVSIGLQVLLARAEDQSTKKYAVVDRTPGRQLAAALVAAAARRNEVETVDPVTGERTGPIYELATVEPSADDRDAILRQRLDLSQRQQKGEFSGFLDIGPDVFAAGPPPRPGEPGDERREVRYQSDKAGDRSFDRWAQRAVNEVIQQRRFVEKGVSQELVRQIQQPVWVRVKGLTRVNPATGAIEDASEESRVANMVLPAILIVLMYVMVLLGAMPAMQGVVEEKQQRIAEVLLGSVTPFQLMLGKLIGVVGVSLTVSAVYLGGGYAVAARYGLTEALSPALLAWFIVYLVLAVFMYGSLFMAVGAAAGDMKETQSLQMPIMLVMTMPMMLLGAVVRDPGGSVAVIGSLVPFSTPMFMTARVAAPPGLPWWQPAAGALLVLATALVCVWAAGRIFRVGLLLQGKGVKMADLARWVISG